MKRMRPLKLAMQRRAAPGPISMLRMNSDLALRRMQAGMFLGAIHARMHAHLTYQDCHKAGRR